MAQPPPSVRARRALGRVKRRTAAIAHRSTLALGPTARAWFRRGRELEREGNWFGAAHAYEAAIARDGDQARWHFRLGRVLERCGRPSAARAAYLRAEELDPLPATLRGTPGRQLPYARRVELSLLSKPAYAYCLHRAALLAQALGVGRITAVELGVAGGKGLLAMERHAADNEAMTGVEIDVVGFDTGSGLRPPVDHRDLPYHFAAGNYAMDEARLRSRLRRAELVIGDAAETFADFLASEPPPIGMVAFDMDLYTPTIGVLGSMGDGVDETRFLPRVRMYFDDVAGDGAQDYNDFTGELLAIREFNQVNKGVKVAEDRHFRTLPLNLAWHHGVHAQHRFDHPAYDTYVHSAGPGSLALGGRNGG